MPDYVAISRAVGFFSQFRPDLYFDHLRAMPRARVFEILRDTDPIIYQRMVGHYQKIGVDLFEPEYIPTAEELARSLRPAPRTPSSRSSAGTPLTCSICSTLKRTATGGSSSAQRASTRRS